MASARIVDLARIISEGTNEMHRHLQLIGMSSPSFDPETLELPQALSSVQDAVIDAANELQELLTDPVNAVHMYGCATKLITLDALQRFDIANCVPAGEYATFARVAEAIGLSEPLTKTLLRHAMTMRIFSEPKPGFVAHTARSMLLRRPKFRNFLRTGMEDMAPAALQTVNAMSKWPFSEEPSHTGFSLANNTDQPMYRVLEQDPERAKRFADTMKVLMSGHGFEVDHVIQGFRWDIGKPVTVVDLGGSDGHVAVALARAYPSLKIIVQDLEGTIESASRAIPNELIERIHLMAHDFFNPQPVSADVYFFRWVFHNWSDKYCVQILKSLIPALRPGARIFINDTIMPEPGVIPFWREKILRTINLNMTTILNSRERDADEWNQLLRKADSRFQLLRTRQPEGSSLAAIEIVWIG